MGRATNDAQQTKMKKTRLEHGKHTTVVRDRDRDKILEDKVLEIKARPQTRGPAREAGTQVQEATASKSRR